MLLESPNPYLPSQTPNTLYSFYPYPITSRNRTHQSLRTPTPPGGPGPSSLLHQESNQQTPRKRGYGMSRAEKRALMGKRPAGIGGGREAEELSDEEKSLEDDRDGINKFGYRFLLPFGRRFTHMEIDQGPDNNQSPSPSEPDQERRQEDRNLATPTSPLTGGANGIPVNLGDTNEEGGDHGTGDGEDEEVVDLDASVEDMDASFEAGSGDDVEPEGEGESMEEE